LISCAAPGEDGGLLASAHAPVQRDMTLTIPR
jgi:hypothetical protein